MTQRNRREGRPSIRTMLVFFIAALALSANGTYQLWNLHAGVPARMTVESCGEASGKLGFMFTECVGHPSGAPDQPSITIEYAGRGDTGHDVNVHISGSGYTATATKDGWLSWFVPLIWLGFGCLMGVGGVLATVRRLRRAPPVTAESV